MDSYPQFVDKSIKWLIIAQNKKLLIILFIQKSKKVIQLKAKKLPKLPKCQKKVLLQKRPVESYPHIHRHHDDYILIRVLINNIIIIIYKGRFGKKQYVWVAKTKAVFGRFLEER